MKIYCYIAIALVLAFVPISLATNKWHTKPVNGKVVLRLSYRGRKQSKSYQDKPYTIGMFEGKHGAFYSGDLMGTDWNGNIYIFDPIDENINIIKRFDKQGIFQEVWEPIRADAAYNVAVTKDGYIWVGLRWIVEEKPNGWPIVVYRSGVKKPIMDWRHKLPKAIDEKVHTFLKEAGFEWKKWEELPYYDFATNDWCFSSIGLQYAQDLIAFDLLVPFLRKENEIISRGLWILISSDGKHLFDMQLVTEPIPYLAPDGTIWLKDSDFNPQNFKWSKIWWWKKGEDRKEPLIDRIKEPWKSIMTTEWELYGDIIQMDFVGNVYVFLKTQSLKSQRRKEFKIFVEGKTIVLPSLISGGELSLVVLDSKRQLLTYLPWQHAFINQTIPCRWIAPLPDGSGFYRIEYREREAVIYFHPLPK